MKSRPRKSDKSRGRQLVVDHAKPGEHFTCYIDRTTSHATDIQFAEVLTPVAFFLNILTDVLSGVSAPARIGCLSRRKSTSRAGWRLLRGEQTEFCNGPTTRWRVVSRGDSPCSKLMSAASSPGRTWRHFSPQRRLLLLARAVAVRVCCSRVGGALVRNLAR